MSSHKQQFLENQTFIMLKFVVIGNEKNIKNEKLLTELVVDFGYFANLHQSSIQTQNGQKGDVKPYSWAKSF